MGWINGLLPLVGVALGAWLAHRYAARQAWLAQAEARRDGQRQVLVGLLVAGRTAATTYAVAFPLLATRATTDDWIEFADTDTGKALRAANAEFSRALTVARLYVGDPALIQHVAALAAFDSGLLRWSDDGTGFDPSKEPIKYAGALTRALNKLENAAAPLLRAPTVQLEEPSLLAKLSPRRVWRPRRQRSSGTIGGS